MTNQQQPNQKTYHPAELGYMWDIMADDQLEPITHEEALTLRDEIEGNMYLPKHQRQQEQKRD